MIEEKLRNSHLVNVAEISKTLNVGLQGDYTRVIKYIPSTMCIIELDKTDYEFVHIQDRYVINGKYDNKGKELYLDFDKRLSS